MSGEHPIRAAMRGVSEGMADGSIPRSPGDCKTLVEEAAFDLYAGGPWGEFIEFRDGGFTAITNAHDYRVYLRMAEEVKRVLDQADRNLLSAAKEWRQATESRLKMVDSRNEAAKSMLPADRALCEAIERASNERKK